MLLWDLMGLEKVHLASVITGKEEYEMTEGQILFENENSRGYFT